MVNKHIQEYLQGLAEELNGKYIEYSDNSVIVTIPLKSGRYQNVKGFINNKGDGIMLVFMSKVCHLNECPPNSFTKLLEMNASLCYSKTVIDQDFVEIIATTKYELCTFDQVRYMIFEVAEVADNLEKEFTGLDVY